jgi:hypothetical protein
VPAQRRRIFLKCRLNRSLSLSTYGIEASFTLLSFEGPPEG